MKAVRQQHVCGALRWECTYQGLVGLKCPQRLGLPGLSLESLVVWDTSTADIKSTDATSLYLLQRQQLTLHNILMGRLVHRH
jgi:hypothetical protein